MNMYAFMEKPQSKNDKSNGKTPGQMYVSGGREEGIPAQLKARMEQRTGIPFDDVRIHYNSERPNRVQALAYTQGKHVYVGPGQEHTLPHEMGHVIQQNLRAVRANASINGLPVNTDERLEREADEMIVPEKPPQDEQAYSSVIQRFKIEKLNPKEATPQNVLELEAESCVHETIISEKLCQGFFSAFGRALISAGR